MNRYVNSCVQVNQNSNCGLSPPFATPTAIIYSNIGSLNCSTLVQSIFISASDNCQFDIILRKTINNITSDYYIIKNGQLIKDLLFVLDKSFNMMMTDVLIINVIDGLRTITFDASKPQFNYTPSGNPVSVIASLVLIDNATPQP